MNTVQIVLGLLGVVLGFGGQIWFYFEKCQEESKKVEILMVREGAFFEDEERSVQVLGAARAVYDVIDVQRWQKIALAVAVVGAVSLLMMIVLNLTGL